MAVNCVIYLASIGTLAYALTCDLFPQRYQCTDFKKDSTTVEQFLSELVTAEVEGFADVCGVGIDCLSGMSYDGTAINYTSGLQEPGGHHNFSAASKSGFHFQLLAQALDGHAMAESPTGIAARVRKAISAAMPLERCIEVLQRKLDSLHRWNASSPGYGGFLPWFQVGQQGIVPLSGWNGRMPGLDNGEMLWGIVAAAQSLDRAAEACQRASPLAMAIRGSSGPSHATPLVHAMMSDPSMCDQLASLRDGYRAYYGWLRRTAVAAFYLGKGGVSSIARINKPQGDPLANGTIDPRGGGVLNDPYEGELMAVWLFLSGLLPDGASGELAIWELKRPQLRHSVYSSEDKRCPGGQVQRIGAQEGFWFSSHEQMKALYLPYLGVQGGAVRQLVLQAWARSGGTSWGQHRGGRASGQGWAYPGSLDGLLARATPNVTSLVLRSSEAARTTDAVCSGQPGLLASCADLAAVGAPAPAGYVSAAGIASLASQPVLRRDLVTPYGSLTLAMADPAAAACWVRQQLAGPRALGPLGATASVAVNGSMIGPVVTWDSKISLLIAFAGGTGDLAAAEMGPAAMGKLVDRLELEYGRVFGPGTSVWGLLKDGPFALPQASIPVEPLGQFHGCMPGSGQSDEAQR